MRGKQFGSQAVTGFVLAALIPVNGMNAAEPDESDLDIFIADQLTYDDNLFRVPGSITPVSLDTGETFSRSDYVNRATLGIDGRWLVSSQAFELGLAADDNRFEENDELDHVSGKARVVWDWQTAGDWSGRLGADYGRSLASFANSRLFTRDLLDTLSYLADVRLGVGSRWALRTGARQFEVSHSASVRELDDFESTMGYVGLDYLTPAGTLFAAEYRRTDAGFPHETFVGGELLQRDYVEDAATFRVRHPFSDKTLFEGSAGYVQREHDNPLVEDYSGDIWRLALNWRPGFKTTVIFAGWRELKAYEDLESDYFKATGMSITPTWQMTEKLRLELAASWEEQDYIGSNTALPDSVARRDTVEAARIGLTYLPREPLSLAFNFRMENRDSNRETYAFDDNLGSVELRFTF